MDSTKGLHKLKYFCQVCNKQLKDKDGFKCHLASNFHNLNIQRVAQNPDYFINNYSLEFEKGFLDIIKRNYPEVYVSSNKVYQEYISDSTNTHLNATKWTNLSSFIKYLKETNKCEVIYDEKESKLKLKDSSFKSIIEKEKFAKKEKELLKEDQRKRQEFKKLLGLDKMNKIKNEEIIKDDNSNNNQNDDLNNIEEKKELVMDFKFDLKKEKMHKNIFNQLNKNNLEYTEVDKLQKQETLLKKKIKRNDDNLNEEQTLKFSSFSNLDNYKSNNNNNADIISSEDIFDFNKPWITENIIVKVKDTNLKEIYNKKGKIIAVEDSFKALVDLSNNIKLKIDQVNLEPVIPQLKSKVMILYGDFKQSIGTLESINIEKKTVLVLVKDKLKEMNLFGICKI